MRRQGFRHEQVVEPATKQSGGSNNPSESWKWPQLPWFHDSRRQDHEKALRPGGRAGRAAFAARSVHPLRPDWPAEQLDELGMNRRSVAGKKIGHVEIKRRGSRTRDGTASLSDDQ